MSQDKKYLYSDYTKSYSFVTKGNYRYDKQKFIYRMFNCHLRLSIKLARSSLAAVFFTNKKYIKI